ncbi:MAG: DUF4366 domain-containing protein [Lachnospiraceae bacterium]|nr:DUF4366 domain-containing protein [Lachnospiraceae bacterium]
MNLDNLNDIVKTVKATEALGVAKANDILNVVKANEIIRKKEEEDKKTNFVLIVCTILVSVAAIAAIVYGLYCYFTPDYLDDFDDDYDDEFDDEFDDDFFENEDE